MSRPSEPSRFGAWRLDTHPQVVEYDVRVLRQIQTEVLRSFRMFAHGGLAVGGVLFGEGEKHLVRILDWRPFACDYSSGPSFALSSSDLDRFREFLEACRADAVLQALVPVGWYRSHTRGALKLTASDRELHGRHFTKPWQIALILEPHKQEPTSAALYVRPHLAGEQDAPAISIPDLSPSSPGDFERSPEQVLLPFDEGTAASLSADRDSVTAAAEPPAAAPEPEQAFEAAPAIPLTAPAAPRARIRTPLYVLLAVVLAAVLWRTLAPPEYWQAMLDGRDAATAYLKNVGAFWSAVLRDSAPQTGLRATMSGSGLLIRWETSRDIANAGGARLEITDGAGVHGRDLGPAELMQGVYTYAPLANDVHIRLTIRRPGLPPLTAATRYLGGARLLEPPAAPNPASREELRAEIQGLQTAILRQGEQNATLEATLKTLKELERSSTPDVASPAKPASGVVQSKPAAVALTQKAPVTPPPEIPRPATPAPAYTGPTSGLVLWTGYLPAGRSVTIDRGTASAGGVSGQLPGVPVNVQVWPADLTSEGLVVYTAEALRPGQPETEEAGPKNSWNRTKFRFDSARAGTLSVTEAPSAANNWSRVSFAASQRPLTVAVIRWTRSGP